MHVCISVHVFCMQRCRLIEELEGKNKKAKYQMWPQLDIIKGNSVGGKGRKHCNLQLKGGWDRYG